MKLITEVSNPKTNQRIKIDLPATNSTIEDVLQRLGCDEIVSLHERSTVSIDMEECNLYELNHLAEVIQVFEDETTHQFIGGCHLISRDGMDLNKAINLAMNIKKGVGVFCQPARNEKHLAEYYLENELIHELEGISEDSYNWLIHHVDLEVIGEEICKEEQGTFISGAYVTVDDLQPLYDGTYPRLKVEDYIFQLKIGLHPEIHDGHLTTIILPISSDEVEQLLSKVGVENLSELTCYEIKSIVPQLEIVDFQMSDLYTLNNLSNSIQCFREQNSLTTFKALLDAVDVLNLESASRVGLMNNEFELIESVRNFTQYGQLQFKSDLPKELYELFDAESYGRKIAMKDGATITKYGVLVPKDGISFQEKYLQLEMKHQTQDQENKIEENMEQSRCW